jgi:hypothetical protein
MRITEMRPTTSMRLKIWREEAAAVGSVGVDGVGGLWKRNPGMAEVVPFQWLSISEVEHL